MDDKNVNNVQNSDDYTVNSIANSEAREEEVKIEGAKQEKADFTQMFGIQSEETQEQKEMSKKPVEIPRVLEVKEEVKQEVVITPEEKKTNHQKNFNSDEKLVYQIEPDKIGNPIVVVLFFAALVGFIIALPSISKKIDFSQLFHTTPKIKDFETEDEDNNFIRLESAASRAKIGNLEIINFVRSKIHNDYLLSFTIQNVGDKIYQFDKKYYIVFYSKEEPMYYALIHSYNGIPSKAALDISVITNQKVHEKADSIKVEEIVESKYPEVRLTETEGEYRVLTCNYNYDEMKYYFINDKLAKIKETYTEPTSDSEYENDLQTFKNLTYKYKAFDNDNFTSTLVEDSEKFSQVNEIYLEKISDNEIIGLKTYRFFRYSVDKNTVAFEMEAQGYICR